MRPLLLAALVTAIQVSAQAAPATARVLDPTRSELDFTVTIAGRKVPGVNRELQGAERPVDGADQVEVRAQTSRFHTNDSTRDVDMKSAIDAARYPTVTFKGLMRGVGEPTQFPTRVEKMVDGQISFHGQTRRVRVPVTIAFTEPGQTRVTTDFDISLQQYGINRPSIFFMHIGDRCHIHADLHFITK